MAYVKLFSEILDSTIWDEDSSTRIVWITLLAMSNRNGKVMTSIPGLAHRSRLTIDDTTRALNKLTEPDLYSRSKDFEGRRIEPIDGGFQLLNFIKYRDRIVSENRKEWMREYMKKRRSRDVNTCKQMSTIVNIGKQPSTHTYTDTYTDTEYNIMRSDAIASGVQSDKSEISKHTPPAPKGELEGDTQKRNSAKLVAYRGGFLQFWEVYPCKKAKAEAYKVWQARKFGPDELRMMLTAIETQKQSEAWLKDAGKFIPHPATWLRQERWLDEEVKQEDPTELAFKKMLENYEQKKKASV